MAPAADDTMEIRRWRRKKYQVILVPGIFPATFFYNPTTSLPCKQPKTKHGWYRGSNLEGLKVSFFLILPNLAAKPLLSHFCFPLRVDLNPRISKICASWMTVWNISANHVLVPLKFNLNWNIWNPFLKTSPLDFGGQRLGNTSFGRVPSISFIFTGSKMARICKFRYYQ